MRDGGDGGDDVRGCHTRSMFREARAGDFDGVMRLYRQLQKEDPVLQDGSDAAVFEQILSTPGLHLFVLEHDGVVVATTYLNVIPNLTRSASPYAVIENVVVEESLRGTGPARWSSARTFPTRCSDAYCPAPFPVGSRSTLWCRPRRRRSLRKHRPGRSCSRR